MDFAWVACLALAYMWNFDWLCALQFRKFVRATNSGITINNVIAAGFSTQCATECDKGENCVMFGFSKVGQFCYISNSESETEEMQPVPTGMKIYQDSSYTTDEFVVVTHVELNWTDARDYCAQHYRGLATLINDLDWQRLVDVISRHLPGSDCLGGSFQCYVAFWVGGYKEDENWYWVVPEGKQLLDHQKWATELQYAGSCVQFEVVGVLSSYYCNVPGVFVCYT